MRNHDNRIAVVSLDSDLTSGSLERVITSTGFDVPTTIPRFGDRLYVVTRASRVR